MPEPTVHSLDFAQDDGWDTGSCSCGEWQCPPVPGKDLVADAFAEHVAFAHEAECVLQAAATYVAEQRAITGGGAGG